ncbi:MAG: serine hydrolase, partial [Bacteroidota bacterium]
MKKLFFLLIATACILSCTTSSSEDHTQISEVESPQPNFQLVLDSIFEQFPESVGILAHVECPDQGISWSGGIGASEKLGSQPIHPDQPALIASSIKTYVSATILRLQEEGALYINDSISNYLSAETTDLFKSDGYDFNNIKIKHLLSHTSGIEDYANQEYIDWIDQNQTHRWTRNEQLQRAVAVGDPLGEAGDIFSYADANYLLCTEIIEQVYGKPFYTAMRELLKYEELGLTTTWFPTLEDQPEGSKEMVHQYWDEMNWDSYNHDISWDLYGGGGIATTTREMSEFSYHLFNGEIIEDPEVLGLMSTPLPRKDGLGENYCLGLVTSEEKGLTALGHGGFWGTVVQYFPELNASVSVFCLNRSTRGQVNPFVMQELVTALN